MDSTGAIYRFFHFTMVVTNTDVIIITFIVHVSLSQFSVQIVGIKMAWKTGVVYLVGL